MLFIDKIVVKTPKGLCLLIGIFSVVVSIIFRPYTEKELYIEGTITEYKEDITHVKNWKGGEHDIEFFYFTIDGIKINVTTYEQPKFKGKESYWKKKLEGKMAKVYYRESYKIYTSVELEDGSYSYHDPHDISYYDVGWFPFCITAPIALFCIFVLLRYFYLLTFASDECRELVFGNKNGDLN